MNVIRVLVEICLLRRGPQHLPAAPAVTGVCLAAYMVSGVRAQTLVMPGAPALPAVVLNAAVFMLLALAVLNFHGFLRRGQQTVSALAGTGTIFTVVGLPVLGALAAEDSGPVLSTLALSAWLGLVVWSFAVTGHILRCALSVGFSIGLLYAMLLFAASVLAYGLATGFRA